MTLRQEATIKDIMENTGKPVSKAMLDNGYAPATAKNPQQLTESKAWQELMNKHFSDERIASKIDEGLEATRTISATVMVKSNDPTVKSKQANARDVDFIDVPDYAVRHKYVETSLKLKGRLKDKEEPTELPNMVVFNIYGDVQPNRPIQSATETINSAPDSLQTGV